MEDISTETGVGDVISECQNHSNDSFPILLFRHLKEHEERLACEKLHDLCKISNQLI